MPVNTNVSSDVPFLTSYTPFGFPLIEATNISDMVTVNIPASLLEGTPIYRIGESEATVYLVSVRNITVNASVEAIFYYSDAVLRNPEGIRENDITVIKKIISPGELLNTQFSLNALNLNSSANYERYPFKFSLKVRNIPNGTIVLKNP